MSEIPQPSQDHDTWRGIVGVTVGSFDYGLDDGYGTLVQVWRDQSTENGINMGTIYDKHVYRMRFSILPVPFYAARLAIATKEAESKAAQFALRAGVELMPINALHTRQRPLTGAQKEDIEKVAAAFASPNQHEGEIYNVDTQTWEKLD